MDCPRCKVRMSTTPLRGVNASVELDSCSSCGGIWFDKGELTHFDRITEPVLFEIRKIPGVEQQLEALYCPACTQRVLLMKASHPRDENVILDYCPSCKGIWLDKGELDAIQKESWLITVGRLYKWLTSKE